MQTSKKSMLTLDQTFPYDLSIAMIFRNDIKYIRQCLETMKPLRDLLRLQLIMTDTGSTDGSRAVAEEYADILLDFTWCDDFSAARNTGVAKAQGRWFAYFDCDHEFDHTISHLAEFVKNPENAKKHHAANIIIGDYLKKGNNTIIEKNARPLLVNFSKGKKEFVLPIHESIPLPPTTITIPMNLFHWGYFENIHLKKARNIPILEKSIKNNPKDLKNYLQLVSEVDSDIKRISLLQQGIHATQGERSQQLGRQVAQITLLACALREQQESLFQETKTTLQSTKLPLGIQLELYGLLTSHALEKNQCEDAYLLFQEFQKLYEQNEKTPDTTTFSQGFFAFKHPSNFYDLERKLLSAFQEQQREAEAIAILRHSQSYLFQMEEHNPFFASAFQSAFALRDFSTLSRYYQYLLKERKNIILHHSQVYLEEETPKLQQSEKEDFQNLFTLEIHDAYTALWKLRQKNFILEDCPKAVADYLSQSHLLHPSTHYSDLLQQYFQTKEDSFGYLAHSPMAQILSASVHLLKKHPSYYQTIEETMETFQKQPSLFSQLPLKEQAVWTNLGFLAVQKESQQEDSTKTLPLFTDVAKAMYRHLESIYKPELLQYHCVTMLSGEEALSCIWNTAQSNPEDVLSYIKSLKEMLQISPANKELILLLMQKAKEQFQQTTKVPSRPTPPMPLTISAASPNPIPEANKKSPITTTKPIEQTFVTTTKPIEQTPVTATKPTEKKSVTTTKPIEQSPVASPEVEALRRKVKEAITLLLTQGNHPQAKIALEKYKTLHPTDPEIPELERQCKPK